MHYCVAYDISGARLRRRVVKWCKEAGLVRLQRSLFTGRSTSNLMRELEENVRAELPSTDRFWVVRLDPEAWSKMLQIGDVTSQKVLGRAKRRIYF